MTDPEETEKRIRKLATELYDLDLLYKRTKADKPNDVDGERKRASDMVVILWKARRRREELSAAGVSMDAYMNLSAL